MRASVLPGFFVWEMWTVRTRGPPSALFARLTGSETLGAYLGVSAQIE